MKKVFNRRYLHDLGYAIRKGLPFSCKVQVFLQFFGIAIHNPFRDECCIDFECCSPHKDKKDDRCLLHISAEQLPIRRVVWYEPTKPAGEPGREFVKKTKVVLREGVAVRFYFVMIMVSMVLAAFTAALGIWAYQEGRYFSMVLQGIFFAVNLGLLFYWTYKSFKK